MQEGSRVCYYEQLLVEKGIVISIRQLYHHRRYMIPWSFGYQ
jgi:hypothetical protein